MDYHPSQKRHNRGRRKKRKTLVYPPQDLSLHQLCTRCNISHWAIHLIPYIDSIKVINHEFPLIHIDCAYSASKDYTIMVSSYIQSSSYKFYFFDILLDDVGKILSLYYQKRHIVHGCMQPISSANSITKFYSMCPCFSQRTSGEGTLFYATPYWVLSQIHFWFFFFMK